MNSFFELIINSNFDGYSIREILLKLHLGKDKIYSFEMEKAFFVNGENVNQFKILYNGDNFKIKLNENIDIIPFPSKVEVVYEDENYLFVNKPRGVLVHDDGNYHDITLANMVACYFKEHRIYRKIRICNRIDVETEGIVMFAKNPVSEAFLNNLISERKVDKKYYVICYHRFSNLKGSIELSIGRNLHESNKMIVYKKGKQAITEYEVIKNGSISLVKANLLTGRTHQIRVHFSYMNHPLLGDKLYGIDDQKEIMGLQAFEVSFFDVLNNKIIKVSLPLSLEMKGLLNNEQ